MNLHETKQTGAARRLFVYLILIAALLLLTTRTTASSIDHLVMTALTGVSFPTLNGV